MRLSTGPRVQHCAPCSIISQMKLIMPVFVHDDNVLGLHARKYCSVSVLQRQKYLFKISGPDWRVCECHLLSQKPLGSSGGACVLLCFTLSCQNLQCFLFLFFFVSTKYYLRQITSAVAWTVVKPFSKEPTADFCCFNFLFNPLHLSPVLFFFCRDKIAFQLSHNPLSIYLLLSNCDLSLCWTLASM